MESRRAIGIGALAAFLVTVIQVLAGLGTTVGSDKPLKWNGFFVVAAVFAGITLLFIVALLWPGSSSGSEPAPASPPAPAPVPTHAPARPGDITQTPEELWAFIRDDLTDLQNQQLIKPFIGKWMTVTGEVDSVGGSGAGLVYVILRRGKQHHNRIWCWFRAKASEELAMLRKGDRVTVRGQIEKITRFTVELDPCELVRT